MSREPMRPAARSAAVRPHSSFLPSPWPVFPAGFGAAPCFASLFFALSPRPIDEQSYWMASACSQSWWEHGHGWERFWEHKSRAFSEAYATVPTVPTLARARVIRARACACDSLSLLLGTWEQSYIVVQNQRLGLFPSLFPAPWRVGTWEQAKAATSLSGRSGASANKIEAGNGPQQRPAVDVRRNFRGTIAAGQAAGELELQRIRQLPTRRGENGGKQPFSARLAGHVGTTMLEGSRQAAENAAETAACPKLGRLRAQTLGELTAGAIGTIPGQRSALLLAAATPGTPNRGRQLAGPLTLHAGGIWIEHETGPIGAVPAASQHDRSIADRVENAQTNTWRRGPGGARLSKAAKSAVRCANREAGERAGVNSPPAIVRPHEAGQLRRLRRDCVAVNGAWA
jgi:hypothetical protein